MPDGHNPKTGELVKAIDVKEFTFWGAANSMIQLIDDWKIAGEPKYCYWYPNTNTFSLGFNL